MDLCDAKITNESVITTVNDLIEIDGILTTSNAIVQRTLPHIQIPTIASCLQNAKSLFNYKLNRKRADSEDEEEEEIAPVVIVNEDDDESIIETSEDSQDDDDSDNVKSDDSDD